MTRKEEIFDMLLEITKEITQILVFNESLITENKFFKEEHEALSKENILLKKDNDDLKNKLITLTKEIDFLKNLTKSLKEKGVNQ